MCKNKNMLWCKSDYSASYVVIAHIRFNTTIVKSKRMTFQVEQRDNGTPDQAKRHEEPPD